MAVSRERYRPGMRRFFDLVLIALVLAAVGFGAYGSGIASITQSNKLSAQDSELNSTTVATAPKKSSNTHRTEIIVGGAIAGTAVLILLGSLGGSIVRSRKRQLLARKLTCHDAASECVDWRAPPEGALQLAPGR